MKATLLSLLPLLFVHTASLAADTLAPKPDFLMRNDSGEITKRGIYTTGANGKVLRYDITDERTKKTLHTEIPVYDTSGEIALTRVYDGEGNLKLIIVFTESGNVKLDSDGRLLAENQFRKIYDSEYKK